MVVVVGGGGGVVVLRIICLLTVYFDIVAVVVGTMIGRLVFFSQIVGIIFSADCFLAWVIFADQICCFVDTTLNYDLAFCDCCWPFCFLV